MTKFFVSMLSSGENGNISTKRVIGFLGFLFLAFSMFISVVSKKALAPSAELVDAVQYITIAALFGNTAEKFAKKTDV